MPIKDRERQLANQRRHYQNNKATYKAKARIFTKAAIVRNRHHVFQYLSTHPCIDCGEKDPIVLMFDHQRDKWKDLSTLIRTACSLTTIDEEIVKCEVRCHNCHVRRTARQQKWTKLLLVPREGIEPSTTGL